MSVQLHSFSDESFLRENTTVYHIYQYMDQGIAYLCVTCHQPFTGSQEYVIAQGFSHIHTLCEYLRQKGVVSTCLDKLSA